MIKSIVKDSKVAKLIDLTVEWLTVVCAPSSYLLKGKKFNNKIITSE